MRTPVEVFEDWARRGGLGPRFHPIPSEMAVPFTYQLDILRRRMEQIRQLPNRGINIHADFIDDGTCGAFAGVEDGIGLIAIHRGMVLLPLDIFNRMLSHPLILAGIGDSRRERIGPQHREGLPEDYDDLVELRRRAGRSEHTKPPDCPRRKAVAWVCAELAWRFIAMHEMIHILHGHVEYLQGVYSIPFIGRPMRAIRSLPLTRGDLDAQSLELWADGKAAQVILSGLLTKTPNPIAGLTDVRERLFLWSFVIYTLYRMWGLTVDPSDLRGKSHPPTAVRFDMAIGGACLEVAKTIPEIGDDFYRVTDGGQREAEKAIAYCGGARLLPEDLAGVNHPLVDAHLDALVTHHEHVLCSEMQKYSHVELVIADDVNADAAPPLPPLQTPP
jgi:hypothetical protein